MEEVVRKFWGEDICSHVVVEEARTVDRQTAYALIGRAEVEAADADTREVDGLHVNIRVSEDGRETLWWVEGDRLYVLVGNTRDSECRYTAYVAV